MGMMQSVARGLIFVFASVTLSLPLRAIESAPELPATFDSTTAPDAVSGNVEVATPAETPEPKDDASVIHKKPSRARWGNFTLGALGGAIFGGGGSALYFAMDSKGHYDQQRALDMALLGAGMGAVLGGVLAFLLGFTDPVPLSPPDMSLQGGFWLADGAGATVQFRF